MGESLIINQHKLLVTALFSILAFALILTNVSCTSGLSDQVYSKLGEANNAVQQAFGAVQAAEKAGADVKDLSIQLNDLMASLARAENAYKVGDFNTALNQASGISTIAQEIMTSSQEAEQTALILRQNASCSTIAFTVIGIAVFASALFLVWRKLKRSYVKALY